jgi:hypothetical protein
VWLQSRHGLEFLNELLGHHTNRLLKRFGMLRGPQHERKNISDINQPPIVPSSSSGRALSGVEGLFSGFQHLLGAAGELPPILIQVAKNKAHLAGGAFELA